MLKRRHVTHLLIPIVLVTVGACGGDSGEDQKASGSSETKTTDGPLAAIFGGSETPAESRRKQLKQEELVAQCMKEKGWDYTPVDWSAQFDNTAGDEDANLSPEEYGKKYAYGIAHSYELYELPSLSGETVDTGVDAGGDDEASSGVAPIEDPNQEYVMGLSESEQSQYYEDLQGPPYEPPTDDTAEFVPPPLEQQGCYGAASNEVYGDSPWQDPELSQRLDELFTNMEDDPQIKEANKKWVECVKEADSSYELTSPNDTYSYFEKLKAELAGQEVVPLGADGAPQGGDQGDMWSSTQNADGSGWAFIGEPKPLDAKALEQLRTDEFKLYKIDQKCQKKVGIDKIRKRVEQELADQILDEFPQLKDDNGG